MGKYKENRKYHVVSIRISDAEKKLLEEMIRRDRTNLSCLMREAVFLYASIMNISFTRG
jgi:hypothetical protein